MIIDTIQPASSISFPFLKISVNPPAYITILGRNIYFYGIIIALGFLFGIIFCTKKLKYFGISEDSFYDVLIRLIPLSIIGARVYFVLFRIEDYIDKPLDVFAIHEGGLAIYGGVIVGVLTIFLYCRRKRISAFAMLDVIIFGLLIGQILGRWGNFFNREAFGAETDIFCRMGLTAPNGTTIYVHPTFLYESLWNLCVFVFLNAFFKKRKYDGQCTLIYFLLYGIGRAWIEGLRTDSLYIAGTAIRISQVLSAVLVLCASILLLINAKKEHPAKSLYVNKEEVEQ